MKRGVSLLLVAIMLLGLAGCAGDTASEDALSAPESSRPGDMAADSQVARQPEDLELSEPQPLTPDGDGDVGAGEDGMLDVTVTINEHTFPAKFYDNESARAIIAHMPFTLDMGDYAGQEKLARLSFDLPAASTEVPDMINIGDLHLYGGNSLVLFYTSFSNVYSYTPVGTIADTAGLVKALGSGSVQVSFAALH